MVNTSDRPISVDGVRLDTLAWNIEKINRSVAGRREANVQVPGRDGVIPSLNDDLEPATLGLEMYVMGTDADGSVPSAGRRDTLRNNLDELVHLFGKRHALLEVREATASGPVRRNMVTTPTFTVATGIMGWSSTYGTSGAGTLVVDPGPGKFTTGFLRQTWTTASTAAAPTLSQPTADFLTARPDVPVSVGVWVRPSVTRTMRVGGRFYSKGAALGSNVYGAGVSCPAGSWTFLSATLTSADPTTVAFRFQVSTGSTTAAPQFIVGETLDYDGFQGNEGPTLDDYVSGDLVSADPNFSYGWEGTPYDSPSYLTAKERRTWAKVTDTIQPELDGFGSSGRFAVGLELPYGVWEDVGTQDWFTGSNAFPGAGVAITIPTLTGATESIRDAIILVQGPVTNPRLTDPNTGAYVELQGVLASTATRWRVNVGTWATRTGTNALTYDSLDTDGTDAQAITRFGGTPNQAAFLPLTPVRSGGARVVQLTLTGTGITTGTRILVRARRKFAL